MLYSNAYDIVLVPGQSAISTDFPMVVVCNCFNNKFVQQGFRHNVWNTRGKYMTVFFFPEANNQKAVQNRNWTLLCYSLKKLHWWTDLSGPMTTSQTKVQFLRSSTEEHCSFNKKRLSPVIENWKSKKNKNQIRHKFYVQVQEWITTGQVAKPVKMDALKSTGYLP